MFDQLGNLAQILAGYDYEQNRARTDHDSRIRQLTALGLEQQKAVASNSSSRGMLHSGITAQNQLKSNDQVNNARQGLEQQFNDRLANLARKRIRDESMFNINSLIPR